MWRRCDLHTHTVPDGGPQESFDAAAFVESCLADGLDLVAVTDHDRVDAVASVAASAPQQLSVVPGLEVTTDRGHLLVLCPQPNGIDVLAALCTRVDISPGASVAFEELLEVARSERVGGHSYKNDLVLIGAHVDRNGSLLASPSALPLERQIRLASQLDALEVVADELRDEWIRGGVKQTVSLPIVQGSDRHGLVPGTRSTYIYLPTVSSASFRHAFATAEASIAFSTPPEPATIVIRRITLSGGSHDMSLEFCDRVNAIIGPPSSGKSLVIDALRWALDQECDIPDLRSAASKRLQACLPQGSQVTVDYEIDGVLGSLTRVRGADERPRNCPPVILFSQNELTQRAIETRPSMALLDIHVGDHQEKKQAIEKAALAVREEFDRLQDLASRAAQLKSRSDNVVDGLEATRTELVTLAGVEATAQTATQAERVASWRRRVSESLTEWRENTFEVPAVADLPPPPALPAESEASAFLREDLLSSPSAAFAQAVETAADSFIASVRQDLANDDEAFDMMRSTASNALDDRGLVASSVVAEVVRLRSRLAELSNEHDLLTALRHQLDEGAAELVVLVAQVDRERLSLRDARRQACTEINDSIQSFFVRLDYEAVSDNLDGELVAAKVGTYFRDDEVAAWREPLDRGRLLTVALRRMQGSPDLVPEDARFVTQDKVATNAVDRGHLPSLIRAATLWPGDCLAINEKPTHGETATDFTALTEGLRALAIKEISFASSRAPVISDQPEDAVPSQRVFESLVPTIRNQRASRQFIVTSHDANLVVAGDAETIWVFDPPQPPLVGDLSMANVREAAIRLLEGGEAALRQRTHRYGGSPL